MTAPEFSAVIVGAGPRGLSVLERICATAGDLRGRLVVHIVDPHPPGSGVHRPQQPHYLLMNTVAGQVSMFRTGDTAARGRPVPGPSLAEWAGTSDDAYLPRNALGRYLAYAFRRFRVQAPESMRVEEHQASAERLRPLADRSWAIHLSDGSVVDADFVFLATGHGVNFPTAADDALDQFAADHLRANPRLHGARSPRPGPAGSPSTRSCGRRSAAGARSRTYRPVSSPSSRRTNVARPGAT